LDERAVKTLLLILTVVAAPPAMAEELRDPTRPPMPASHAAEVHEAAPVLSAIMGSGQDRVAIFNGQLVRSGGSVGPYAIQEVFEDGVRYRHAGLVHELYLPRTVTFKKPSTAAARTPAGDH
jgi:hypothetical protein